MRALKREQNIQTAYFCMRCELSDRESPICFHSALLLSCEIRMHTTATRSHVRECVDSCTCSRWSVYRGGWRASAKCQMRRPGRDLFRPFEVLLASHFRLRLCLSFLLCHLPAADSLMIKLVSAKDLSPCVHVASAASCCSTAPRLLPCET